MPTTIDRAVPKAPKTRSDWRESPAFASIRKNIRAAVSDDPALADEFADPVDPSPQPTALVERAQSGEFAAQAIQERFGEQTLSQIRAMTGVGD